MKVSGFFRTFQYLLVADSCVIASGLFAQEALLCKHLCSRLMVLILQCRQRKNVLLP